MGKKVFLIACEPSGDAHGAHLVAEMKAKDPLIDCRGLGGPKMKQAGVSLLYDMTTFSALGFGDVVRQYFQYRKIFYQALENVRQDKPDVLVLIDSPAFNLRFAKKIKKSIPTLYYISPQLWAWGGRRIHTVKKTVTKMIVILPFEKDLYAEHGIPCEFVGHPLLDQVKTSAPREELRRNFGIRAGQTAIGLLPGSRESEVKRILPLMLQTANLIKTKKPDASFFLTEAPNVPKAVYDDILNVFPKLEIRRFNDRLYDLILSLDFALIASGTATTEAAILGTPFFLLYKASWSTYWIGRCLVRVPYLGLVNILAGKAVVPEFIQGDIVPKTIAHEAEVLLRNQEVYQKIKRDFSDVKLMLGQPGASRRAALAVLEFIRSGNTPRQTPVSQSVHS